MCLQRASTRSLRHLAITLNLRRNLLSSFPLSRHCLLANNRRLLHTVISSNRSFFFASPATAHSEKFICWINKKFFSVLSRVAIKRRVENYSEHLLKLNSKDCRKMVWISSLDNPKVNDRLQLLRKVEKTSVR